MSEDNLTPEGTFTDELLEQFFQAVRRQERSQWEIGDLAIKVVARDGADSLKHWAKVFEIPYTKLNNWTVTSTAYDQSNRLDYQLDWGHYFVVHTLPDRMKWLQAALECGWSKSALRAKALPPGQKAAKTSKPTARINVAINAMKAALKGGATVEELRAALEEVIKTQEEPQ